MNDNLKKKILDGASALGLDLDGDIIHYEGVKYYVHVLHGEVYEIRTSEPINIDVVAEDMYNFWNEHMDNEYINHDKYDELPVYAIENWRKMAKSAIDIVRKREELL